MPISSFMVINQIPNEESLYEVLGTTYPLWKIIERDVFEKDTTAKPEWHYSGVKFGWSYRIKEKKRVIVYLLPRNKYFKVAFVFGQKATDSIMNSTINNQIKTVLQDAKGHAEGKGIRIDIKEDSLIEDIKKLIQIKINH
jgi:hypothetical protein